MDELEAELRATFEDEGYEVGEVSENRGRVRVVVLDEGAHADELRAITERVVDEEDVLGLDVTTETIDGQDAVGTVVSFRRRS